jgi:hypothetical protein
MKPPKYILLACYVFEINTLKINADFYKYTGLYFVSLKNNGCINYYWFSDKNILNKSISLLKTKYFAKKIHISKNKRNNIELSPEGICFFNCQSCDHNLYIRNQIWEIDNDWEKCEKEGIFLETDKICCFNWRSPPDDVEKYDISINDCIKCEKMFIDFVDDSIQNFSEEDEEEIFYDDTNIN